MSCGIYGIKNLANGKIYVGQSVEMEKRKNLHLYYLRRGTHYNAHLQSAFLKYGESNFEFHILEEVSENMLDVRECAWIGFYKSDQELFGYNLMTGGKLLKRHSKESRLKMSLAKMGVKFSAEHCQKLGESNRRRTLSKETHKKMSVAAKRRGSNRTGSHFSVETRKEMSRVRKEKPWSELRRNNFNNKHSRKEQ